MPDHTPSGDAPHQTTKAPRAPRSRRAQWALRLRVTWAVVSILLTESVILGMAVLPAVSFWAWLYDWSGIPDWAQVIVMAMAFVPAYLLFATSILLYSAFAAWAYGWRTPPGLNERIADMTWPVLDWGRYLMTIHVARLFAGAVFRSTPVWSMYLRLNGARLGRGCWVNSLKLMDHSLLEFSDRVVIGSDASVSGHIIERGMLKTAPVRLGRNVTIGINSVVGIGTTIGHDTQVGALSVVPKFSQLEHNAVYAGAPVRRVTRESRALITPVADGLSDEDRAPHAPVGEVDPASTPPEGTPAYRPRTGARGDVGLPGARGDVGLPGARGDVGLPGVRGDVARRASVSDAAP
jgi:acetyltransferase-like isoleucine patch superfamily enzyme